MAADWQHVAETQTATPRMQVSIGSLFSPSSTESVESLIFCLRPFPDSARVCRSFEGEEAMTKFYYATAGIIFGMAAGTFVWPVAFTIIF